MDIHLIDIINACIELETKIATLYSLFGKIFEIDRSFWIKLSQEEKNHVRLLTLFKESYSKNEYVPEGFQFPKYKELETVLQKLDEILVLYKDSPPSRKVAFQVAYKFEESAGEMHYQTAMNYNSSSDSLIGLYQQLNSADKDHSKRIMLYLQQNP